MSVSIEKKPLEALQLNILISLNPHRHINVATASPDEISKTSKLFFDNKELIEIREMYRCLGVVLKTLDKNDEKEKAKYDVYYRLFYEALDYEEKLEKILPYHRLSFLEKINYNLGHALHTFCKATNFLNIDFENGDFPAPIIYVKDNGLFAPPTYY